MNNNSPKLHDARQFVCFTFINQVDLIISKLALLQPSQRSKCRHPVDKRGKILLLSVMGTERGSPSPMSFGVGAQFPQLIRPYRNPPVCKDIVFRYSFCLCVPYWSVSSNIEHEYTQEIALGGRVSCSKFYIFFYYYYLKFLLMVCLKTL